ncbi:Ankyrin repeat domain-containing protein [Entamoeba marina]
MEKKSADSEVEQSVPQKDVEKHQEDEEIKQQPKESITKEKNQEIIHDDQPPDDTTLAGSYTVMGYVGKYVGKLFENGEELLIRTVYEGDAYQFLDYYQDNPKNLLITDSQGNSFLHIAVMARQTGMLSFLLNMGMNPNRVNFDGENILMTALRLGFNDVALEILHLPRFKFDQTDLNGNSVLHYCARYGRAIICNEILKHEININLLDFKRNNALHICCENKSLNVAKVLLYHHIKTNQRNCRSQIPLHVAVQEKKGIGQINICMHER